MEKQWDMVYSHGVMVINMKVNGIWVSNMEKVLTISTMEITSEESTNMENLMAMECILGQMAAHMKGTFKVV
jgi:hypothetical protein